MIIQKLTTHFLEIFYFTYSHILEKIKIAILILAVLGITVSSCQKDEGQIDINVTDQIDANDNNQIDIIDDAPITIQDIMVDVGGYQLYTLTSGTGNSTVVFEAGWGNGGKSWYTNDIFSSVAQSNQVISYNRAGYSPSEFGDDPRDLIQLSAELHKIITEVSQNDKVILVGHSLGGAIIQYYAYEHPEKIKAILFIDPTVSVDVFKMTQSEEDAMVKLAVDLEELGIAKEAEQFMEDYVILDGLPNLPNVPIRVLTSQKLEVGLTLEMMQDWSNAHKALGEGIDDFKQIETDKGGHYIHFDEPELVLNALNEIID